MNDFFEELEKLIKAYYKVDIKQKNRKREYVDSRMIFTQISIEFLKVKKKIYISRYLCVDHATTLNSLNNFKGVYVSDKEFKDNYNNILKDFKILYPHILKLHEKAQFNRLKYHKKMIKVLSEGL